MSKELSKIYKQQKKLKDEGRVVKDNKEKVRKMVNKFAKEYGGDRLTTKATISQINQAKKQYIERIGYDIMVLAIEEGNITTADITSKELKNSEDKETKKLATYSVKLASAKQSSNSYLSKDEKKYLDDGNANIKGYGNEDIISEFEKTKSKKGVEKLIEDIKNQNPKEIFYDKEIETFLRVFQKVGGVREEDLKKVTEKLNSMDFEEVVNESNYLLASLEIYGSPDNKTGAWGSNETELANARLDDVMIRTGLKKGGQQKVNRTFKKYKVDSGYIPNK